MAKNKRVYIKTFGCQMNVRDSEFVAGVLIDNGFRLVDSPEKADVMLFNSCSVRKRAEDRLFGNITDLGGLKKKNPSLVIALMGCTAQAYKDEAFKKAPMIDIVCGPGNESDLPRLIRDVFANRCAIVAADKLDAKRPELFPGYRSEGFKAYVSIGEGCNNFCSYCIVPYVRGRERSRDAKDIIKEARDLAARGFKEVTLLGQNVNSYRGIGFVGLLEKINRIKGIERMRFMTSHPKDAHIELFKAMRDLEKVCEHLHLPLQSGSDRILKLMNRGYTAKKYTALAEKFKKLLPEGSITTDIIVGFPSETEKDFKKTCAVMDAVGFDNAFTFQYSPRPSAKASKLKDDVPKEEKVRRLQAIVELQCRSSEKHNRSLVGKTVEVLVDGVNRKDRTQLSGRTRTNRTAVFKGKPDLVGRLVNIKVRSATPYALIGL
jgi:tRNA-2-methylthio-N6-dimethylallyladenosine synthase